MNVVVFLLLLIAFICFIATALGATVTRVGLLPLGLALWVLALLLPSLAVLLRG
jgi:hypothetical protein